jgi:hypothetical protein
MKVYIFYLFLFPFYTFGQTSAFEDSNFIFWNKNRPLTIHDFKIKTNNERLVSGCSGQYSWDYNIIGAFTFGLSKDYKKKIRNYFIKSASWIDTTSNTNISIRYQQTLFNMSEVYVRLFRKAIFDNRRKITWGKININELNSQFLTDFSKKRVQYDLETNYGTLINKQLEWEMFIQMELKRLNEFAVE